MSNSELKGNIRYTIMALQAVITMIDDGCHESDIVTELEDIQGLVLDLIDIAAQRM